MEISSLTVTLKVAVFVREKQVRVRSLRSGKWWLGVDNKEYPCISILGG